MKFLKFLTIIVLLSVVSITNIFAWDYTETFTNNNASATSYTNGSFTGDNGIVWNYEWGRKSLEAGYPIDGQGFMFRAVATGFNPRIFSNPIPGGITDFRVYLRKGFTGSGLRSVALYINGEFIAQSEPYDVNNEIRVFEVKDINIPGNVVIELRNLGPQFVIDNLSWTIYGKPGNGVPTRSKVVKYIPENPIQGIPFKAVIQLVDDNDQPQKLSTNTLVNLQVTKANGTLTGVTSGVIPAGQTTIVFDNLVYDDEDLVTFTSATPNNKTGDAQFLRDINSYVDFLRKPVITVSAFPYGHAGAIHPPLYVYAIGEEGIPYKDFSNFNATLTVNQDGNPINTYNVKFDRGIATFNNVTLSNTGNYTLNFTAEHLGTANNYPVNVLPMPTMTDIIIPRFIKGDGTFFTKDANGNIISGNGRMPTYALVRFNNLHPGVEYRFLVGSADVVPSTKPITPGNLIAYNPYTNTYSYPASKDLSSLNTSSAVIASTNGTATTWIGMVPTSNSEFNTGKDINWCIDLGNAQGTAITRLYSTNKSRTLTFSTACNSSQTNMLYATGIYDNLSPAQPKNYVVLYDINNNPISTALVQVNGSVIKNPGFDHQCPPYYELFENVNGAFATIIPNNLTNGIRKIVEYDNNGNTVNQWTDTDGIWAGYRTDDCGYSMFPPLPNSGKIQFSLPQISIVTPAPQQEFCNIKNTPVILKWNSRGLSTIDIWISIDGGNYELLDKNIDARKGYFEWYVQRGKFADKPLKIKITSPEYSYISTESSIFYIYDEPIVTNHTKSMNYCVNSNVVLTVEAEGSLLKYQWYKDKKLVVDGGNFSGAKTAVLRINNITHNNAGTYYCVVSGHSSCPTASTEPIAVHPVRNISFITPEKDVTIGEVLGNTVTLTFRVHINGFEIPPQDYKRYDIKVQWFKKINETTNEALVENKENRFSGVKSDYLTIRDFQSKDVGTYFAEVTGMCGVNAKSPMFKLVEVDISIAKQPSNNSVCINQNVSFESEAKTSSNEIISYQWYKNNTPLNDDSRISGAKTTKLTIKSANKSDEGDYNLKATLSASGQSVNSQSAKLKVNSSPTILNQPASTKTITEGTQLSLEVIAEGNTPDEELIYQWFFNGKAIESETLPILAIDNVKIANTGDYYCEVTNKCGTIKSEVCKVTVTPKQTTDVEEIAKNGVSLSIIKPNPINNIAYFNISSNLETFGKIKIIDFYGNLVSTIYQGMINAGIQNYNFDVNSLNISSGTYFIVLETIQTSIVQKFIVIK